MPITINEDLKIIANNSAVKNSAVPIFICDENLTVCAKSVGAERFFSRPAVRNSIRPYIPENAIEKLNPPESRHVSVTFSRSHESSYCILTEGVIKSHKYYAFIIEPMIQFCPDVEPWYIEQSCTAVTDALHRLIADEKHSIANIDAEFARFSRLCTFTNANVGIGSIRYDVNDILNTVIKESTARFGSVYTYTPISKSSGTVIAAEASPIHMYTFLATLIVSAMSLSQDGKLTLSCETVEGENAAEIKISTHTNKYLSKTVECYDDLIIPANPFTLELAALKDCAASNSFKLEAKQTDSELVLSLRFPGKLEQNGVLRAQDIDNSDRKYFVSLLYELFDMLPAKN